MKFKHFETEVLEAHRNLQDIQSVFYAVYPAAEGYMFVSEYDITQKKIVFILTDESLNRRHLLADIPVNILLAYSDFIRNIQKWEDGVIDDHPYLDHAGSNINLDKIHAPKHNPAKENIDDTNYDGSEGVLK